MNVKYGFKYRCKCVSCKTYFIADSVDFKLNKKPSINGGFKFTTSHIVTSVVGCPYCGDKNVSSVEQVN